MQLPPSAVMPAAVMVEPIVVIAEPIMVTVEPVVVKTTMVKIIPVFLFEVRTVMFEIEAVPIVAVPGRIIIVGIAREFGFTNLRSGIVSACIFRSRGVCVAINDRRSDVDSGYRHAYTKAGTDIHLGIALCSDKAGGYDCG